MLEAARVWGASATVFFDALPSLPQIVSCPRCNDAVFAQDNGTVASGPCPSCGADNRVFFGSMLGVQGNM